jgi:hypothetical protein
MVSNPTDRGEYQPSSIPLWLGRRDQQPGHRDRGGHPDGPVDRVEPLAAIDHLTRVWGR